MGRKVVGDNKTNGKNGNGANLGFEQKLWAAADKMRSYMDPAEYKHVVLGLIFLKYISDSFQERYEDLKNEPHADPEDRDEYAADNVFWVPSEARWQELQDRAKQPEINCTLPLPCTSTSTSFATPSTPRRKPSTSSAP